MAAQPSYVFTGSGAEGTELWTTDGTAEGTRLLRDLRAGTDPDYGFANSGFPQGLTLLPDGRLLFGAYGDGGFSLWTSDGTEQGTTPLEAASGPGLSFADASPYRPLALPDGRVLFQAADHCHGTEPWITDGTAAGTVLLADVVPGRMPSLPASYTLLGAERFLFSAQSADTPPGVVERELYVSDGTAGGTYRVVDHVPGTDTPLNPASIMAVGEGRALFTSDLPRGDEQSPSPGKLFWVTDGTPEGTERIPQLRIDAPHQQPLSVVTVDGGRIAFTIPDGKGAQEAWISDGTVAGTHRIADLPIVAGEANGGGLQALGDGRLLMLVHDGGDGLDLWVSDGTPEGSEPLLGGLPAQASFLRLEAGRMLFSAGEGSAREETELWITDGTPVGTGHLGNLPGYELGRFFGAAQPMGDGSWIFGAARDAMNHSAVWRTDAQPGGTVQLAAVDINTATGDAPLFFMAAGPVPPGQPTEQPMVAGDPLWA